MASVLMLRDFIPSLATDRIGTTLLSAASARAFLGHGSVPVSVAPEEVSLTEAMRRIFRTIPATRHCEVTVIECRNGVLTVLVGGAGHPPHHLRMPVAEVIASPATVAGKVMLLLD